MEVNHILKADLLDLLFEGKNKEYGAYDLRKTYNKRMMVALTGMFIVCLAFSLGQILANDGDKRAKVFNSTEVVLANLPLKEKIAEPIHVPPPQTKQVQVRVKQFTTPLIVDDTKATDPPPVIEDLIDARIGLSDHDGSGDDGFVAPPVENSIATIEGPKKETEEDYTKIFTKVEKEARFPGGMEAWKRYLERNLNANIAADEGAPEGSYTVKVQFVVDREGGLSNVEAVEVPKACPGCAAEAVKIIKRGPKWEPAIQNGRKVNYQAIQFVTFQVTEQ